MDYKASDNGGRTALLIKRWANERLLNVSEAARMVNAHPNSVRRWANLGLLPSYRIGIRGDRRFKFRDLARFLASWKNGRYAKYVGGLYQVGGKGY